MSEIDIVSAWTLLQKSNSDLTLAFEISKMSIPGQKEQLGLHLQQSIEKSIKSILMLKGIPFSVSKKAGHNLTVLLNHLNNFPEIYNKMPQNIEKISLLQDFAVSARYEDVSSSESVDFEEMLNLAEDIYNVANREYELTKSESQ